LTGRRRTAEPPAHKERTRSVAVATREGRTLMSVDQFRAFVDAESGKYVRIIKETGVSAE
jgi:hypothetical protein